MECDTGTVFDFYSYCEERRQAGGRWQVQVAGRWQDLTNLRYLTLRGREPLWH